MTAAEFTEMCRALRELGVLEVSAGDFAAKFGPGRVLPPAPKPQAPSGELSADEWRERAIKGDR